jgi:hypothetical protein
MKGTKSVEVEEHADTVASDGVDLFRPLIADQTAMSESASFFSGVVVGELIAITDDGRTPLVTFPGRRESVAVAARSIVDLHSAHIGRQVVLVFDGGESAKPIVIGVLRTGGTGRSGSHGPRRGRCRWRPVDRRRKGSTRASCGKASITLTKAGKVLIQGSYILSRASGANRIKGGSVQLN